MKNQIGFFGAMLLLSSILFLSFKSRNSGVKFNFPYQKEKLTERQAAAHLLSRFTYGATPGQVDEVVKLGLEKWFEQQLTAALPDEKVNSMLDDYSSLRMTNEEIVQAYPKNGVLERMAIRDGVIVRGQQDKEASKKALASYRKEHNYKPPRALFRELTDQKILRAVYSQNQLQEMLTGFWFNHFNVSFTDNDCAQYIVSYERDAIRPNALGRFEDLLLATAKSPAMLSYLDNFKSAAPAEAMTPEQEQKQRQQLRRRQLKATQAQQMQVEPKLQKVKKEQGLNENYAREVMELHTLGVDGGYTQRDVTQVARIFTGWTISPGLYGNLNNQNQNKHRNWNKLAKQGFVQEGDFLFAANRHDKGEKVVMGTRFPAGGGYEEGLKLINMLAQHPSTARFISTKLAVRFVSDNPSKSLIDTMAKAFTKSNGDIREVLIAMVSSREFWSKEALREKTKSPFELAISSVRSLNGEVTRPAQLSNWITKMGERLYAYQAPTGYPDNSQYWINTGSLLARMNFGLALASRSIPGVQVDLAALNQNREPESPEQALQVYSSLLMPERNLEETIKRLTPHLTDPEYSERVNKAASQAAPVQEDLMMMEQDEMYSMDRKEKAKEKKKEKEKSARKQAKAAMQAASTQNMMLAQVVGIIVGSPEFQRR